MPFTVRDFQDLVHVLEEHPEWQAELRRLVLTEELLTLPAIVRELAEAQRRTEEQVRALVEAQRRTEQRVEELAEAQRRTEERVQSLAEALEALTRRVDQLTDDVGDLKGSDLERRYRERAPAYFDDLLRRIYVLSAQELAALLDEPVAKGVLSQAERKDLLMSDVVVRGRRRKDDGEAYLVVEVSVGIGKGDVERAVRRAEVLSRALEQPSMAVVAGEWITPKAEQQARQWGVWRVLDGRALAPTEE